MEILQTAFKQMKLKAKLWPQKAIIRFILYWQKENSDWAKNHFTELYLKERNRDYLMLGTFDGHMSFSLMYNIFTELLNIIKQYVQLMYVL